MKTRWEPKILKAVNDNRLLVISPFEQKIKRVTRETAEKRNRKIIKISDKITIAYKSKSGQLEKSLKGIGYEQV